MKTLKTLTALFASFWVILYSAQIGAQTLEVTEDLWPGNGSSWIEHQTEYNGKMYLQAQTQQYGKELYSFDGCDFELVADINPSGYGSPLSFTELNNILYFIADDGTAGRELWSFDGTNASLEVDINSGSASSNICCLAVYNSKLYFRADNGVVGSELFSYDGNTLTLEADINSGSGSSSLSELTVFNGVLYFKAYHPSYGTELWKFDGNNASIAANIRSGTNSGNPSYLKVYNNYLYFQAYGNYGGRELWRYNGSSAHMAANMYSGNSHSNPFDLTIFNGELYFGARNGSGSELWKFNGSSASMVADIVPGSGGSFASKLTVFDNKLYFRATDGINGAELWSYDGSTASMVEDIRPGSPGSNPDKMFVFQNALYFTASNTVVGNEMYLFDPVSRAKIEVSGNSQVIEDGQSSASISDHTDFGSSPVGTPVTRTFAIENTGDTTLTIPTVTISGTNASAYAVSQSPATSVNVGSTTTLQVTFTPSAIGQFDATVNIQNNDPCQNPFDFAVTGTGPLPEMNVTGNSVTIADSSVTTSLSDHTDFGSTPTGTSVSRVFTIENSGQASLIITHPISITGAGSGQFSVTQTPQSSVSIGNSTTFEITYTPSSTIATHNAIISVASNDPDENPYTFAVTAKTALGVVPFPTLCTSDTARTFILSNCSDPINSASGTGITSQVVGSQQTNFNIFNKNGGSWTPSNNMCNDGHQNSPGASQTFSISGITSIDVHISHADCGTPNVFTFSINGVAVQTGTSNGSCSCTPTNYTKTYTITGSALSGLTGTNDVLNVNCFGLHVSIITATITSHQYEFLFDPVAAGVGNHVVDISACGETVQTTVDVIDCTVPVTWTGSVSTDFANPLNWNPNIVPSGNNVIIDGSLTNQPSLSGLTTFTVGDVSLSNNGNVTLISPATLNIDGDFNGTGYFLGNGTMHFNSGTHTINDEVKTTLTIEVPSGANINSLGNLVLGNGASLMHGTGTPGGGGTVNGNIKVEKEGSTDPNRYNHWGVPVSGPDVSQLGGTVYKFDETHNDATNFRNDWKVASGAMNPGEGYTSKGSGTQVFEGTAGDGNKVVSVTNTSSSNVLEDGWNFVSNPYPSALDAADFVNANSDIDGTLHFWADPGTGENSYQSTHYATWNMAGTTSTGGGSVTPNGKIGSGQGFFVRKSTTGNGTATFTNAMRRGDNSQFFRTGNDVQRVKLNVTDVNGAFDETLIAFSSDASDGWDRLYDGVKVPGNSLNIYTELDQRPQAIQTWAPLQENTIVPVVVTAGVVGEMTLNFSNENFESTVGLWLEDRERGVWVNLKKEEPYTFWMDEEAAVIRDRFFVHINVEEVENHSPTGTSTGIEPDESQSVQVYATAGSIILKSENQLSGELRILNVKGQLVHSQAVGSTNEQSITLDLSDGNYLVEYNTSGSRQTFKMYLSR